MGIDRRKFLKGMGSLALFSIVPSKVLGGPNHIAPSDQLTKGIIGVGGIGRSSYHFTSNEQCRLVSVCDVDKNHLQKAVDLGKKKFNETLQTYHDFRDLIKDSNVVIVQIAWLAIKSNHLGCYRFHMEILLGRKGKSCSGTSPGRIGL